MVVNTVENQVKQQKKPNFILAEHILIVYPNLIDTKFQNTNFK